MQLLTWYLTITAHLLLCGCLVGLALRKLVGRHPAFLIYIAFQLLQFLSAFVVQRLMLHSLASLTTYRWIMVVGACASSILELLVLYEVLGHFLLSRSSLQRSVHGFLRWSGALLILAAASTSAWLAQPGIQRVMSAFDVLNFSANLIVLGLLLVLLVVSRALQVPWRALPAGIVLGFGLDAATEMGATALMSALGSKSYILMDLVRVSAFLGGALVWLVYVLLPDRAPAVATLDKTELEFWNQEMQRMVRR